MSNTDNNIQTMVTPQAVPDYPINVPDISTPLVAFPNQNPVVGQSNIGYLNFFIGTWNSQLGANATGYNVMPLPQVTSPTGYITKNFPYFEEITFAPIAGGGPNRQGDYTQNSFGLFYEQRVYIANNTDPMGNQPIQNTLIHAENGTWLFHTIVPQLDGAFGPGTVPYPGSLPVQNPATQYNKLVSIPHGNTLLMTGNVGASGTGAPVFTSTPRVLPPFTDTSIIDPVSYLTNQIQTLAGKGITVEKYVRIDVATTNPGGGVNNINFETLNSQVISLTTSWFIEWLSDNSIQLQYVQNIVLQFHINGVPTKFLHVDANTLQLVETFAQVSATTAWQDSGIVVADGKPVTISYKAGQWTADPQTNGGNLYDANGCPGITVTQSGYPVQGVNMGSLVGQVGSSPPFYIGNGPVQTPAGQSGPLQLCINDDLTGQYGAGLTDNVGAINVKIKL